MGDLGIASALALAPDGTLYAGNAIVDQTTGRATLISTFVIPRAEIGGIAIGPNKVACGEGLNPVDDRFRRGDVDDNGAVQLTDAVGILNFLFTGGEKPTCMETADANDDGAVQLTDVVRVLTFLFSGGPAPAPPGPEACGADPADSPDLGCASYTSG